MRLFLLPWLLAASTVFAADEAAFHSSGRYDRSLSLSLEASAPLLGKQRLQATIRGGEVAAVRFYVDGELAGVDEKPPFVLEYDFPAGSHRLMVVGTTTKGTKVKRILRTGPDGRADGLTIGATAPPENASQGSRTSRIARSGAALSETGLVAVRILEPWGSHPISGTRTIAVDARGAEGKKVVKVEILVDRKPVKTFTKAPYSLQHDFGEEPRPHLVTAIAYLASGDAASATWESGDVRPPESAAPLKIVFRSPKEGGYLIGPVKLEVEVRAGTAARVDFFVDERLVGTARKAPFQVAFDAGKKVLAHRIKAYAYDRDGHRAAALVKTKPLDVDLSSQVREVVLQVSFEDRRGRPVVDVTKDEIEVKENGKIQEVTGVEPDARPMLLALVLDASGSMERKLADTRQAAASFVDQLGARDQALVLSFSSKPHLLVAPTSDKAALKQGIASIQAEDSTALYDAVMRAIEEISKAATAKDEQRKAIILLSDGEDSGKGQGGSDQSYDDVEKAALLRGVRIYTIDIASTPGAGIKAVSGSAFVRGRNASLQGLSDQTGGEAYFVQALGELREIYSKVAMELRRLYRVSYLPSRPGGDGGWRRIKVRSKKRKLEARTRSGYYATGS